MKIVNYLIILVLTLTWALLLLNNQCPTFPFYPVPIDYKSSGIATVILFACAYLGKAPTSLLLCLLGGSLIYMGYTKNLSHHRNVNVRLSWQTRLVISLALNRHEFNRSLKLQNFCHVTRWDIHSHQLNKKWGLEFRHSWCCSVLSGRPNRLSGREIQRSNNSHYIRCEIRQRLWIYRF